MTTPTNNDWIWRPQDHAWTAQSHIARFMAVHKATTFAALRERAAKDTAWFWDAAMKDIGLSWFTPYKQVRDDSAGFPWTKWFIGGKINVTYNCIDRHCLAGYGDETAIYYEADSDAPEDRKKISYRQLAKSINRCANAMIAAGVGPGDAIGLYAPMRVETVIVFFAAMKIGATIVPVFCGFGEHALVERLESCNAKLLFAADTLMRRGKPVGTAKTAVAAAKAVPTISKLVFIDTPSWEDFLSGHSNELDAAHTAAEDPCLIIYTSGTTGRPKGTVHTHIGCLAQMGKELRYAFDVQTGEPFFWVTDIGWMMGPWMMIGALLYRAPIVLFDGAPNYPTPDRIWQIVERLKVVTLGISPTLIRLLMREEGAQGPGAFDLKCLRVLGSTGEAWDEKSYTWFFEKVGRRKCPVINISGGTEIVGCHLMPHPVEPIKACTLGGGALGMDVDVFNEEGQPVRGEVGYLVCKQPAPSMTKGFLHDNERYIETYFSKFKDVWNHGDWASIDADGLWYLHGRADDTIKVAGKRVGPAEVESVLISHPGVSEAATIGVPDDLKGQVLVCFVVLKPGAVASEEGLIGHVTRGMGKPLAPKAVHIVDALPKTRSGKIVRATIKRAYLGEPVGDLASVENPHALDAIGALNK